jgi:hypothetical protein
MVSHKSAPQPAPNFLWWRSSLEGSNDGRYDRLRQDEEEIYIYCKEDERSGKSAFFDSLFSRIWHLEGSLFIASSPASECLVNFCFVSLVFRCWLAHRRGGWSVGLNRVRRRCLSSSRLRFKLWCHPHSMLWEPGESEMSDDEQDFSWTTEYTPEITHCRFIGRGGGGEVHEVSFLLSSRLTVAVWRGSKSGMPSATLAFLTDNSALLESWSF